MPLRTTQFYKRYAEHFGFNRRRLTLLLRNRYQNGMTECGVVLEVRKHPDAVPTLYLDEAKYLNWLQQSIPQTPEP